MNFMCLKLKMRSTLVKMKILQMKSCMLLVKEKFRNVKTEKQTKKNFEIKPKIYRKRLRYPQEWKQKKATMCKERGLQYVKAIEKNVGYSVDLNLI